MEKKMFKTETHLHTSESSGCSALSAEKEMYTYAEKGYSTVFVSDHLGKKYYTSPYCSCARDYIVGVTRFLRGYYHAKEAGEKLGITVLMSAEVNLGGNDHLLYGIDEKFLCSDPPIPTLNSKKLFERANEYGVTVIAAHPFRGDRKPKSDFVHGLEIVNAADNHYYINNNDKALALAEQMPHLLRTSGSDCHHIEDAGRGGIITDHKITSAEDFIEALKSGNYEIIDISPEKAAENN